MNTAEEIRGFQSPGIFKEDDKSSFPLNKSIHDMNDSHNTHQSLLPRHIFYSNENEAGSEGKGNKYIFNGNLRTSQ